MTAIESSAFQRLEAEGRLLKPALKGPTSHAGRFGFRGEIALVLDPPLTLAETFATADDGDPALAFLAGSLAKYTELPALVETLGPNAKADGKYFIFVADLDRSSRYQVSFGEVSFYVMPIDGTSVYNELIDALYLDKTRMKKFSTAEKLDTIVDGAAKFETAYEKITYDEGLQRITSAAA